MEVFTLKRFSEDRVINEEVRAEQLITAQAADVESKLILCDDHTMGFCFECQPLSGGSDNEFEQLKQLLSLNYPANTTMSFLLFRSPDIEEHISAAERLRFNFKHPLLTPVFKDREKFLRDYTMKDLEATSIAGAHFNIGRVVDVKLIISVKIPYEGEVPSADFVNNLNTWATQIGSTLKTIGFAPFLMDPNRYLRFLNVMLNWREDATWRQRVDGLWERDKPLSVQCLDPETSIFLANKHWIRLGDDMYVKMMSAKKFPEVVYFGNAIQYIGDLTGGNQGIHNNYAVCCNILFPDPNKMKDELNRKRTWANNQAYGPLEKFEPILGEIKKSFDIIYKSDNDGARPLKISYHVALFAKSEKEIEALSAQTASFWSNQRFTLKDDTHVMFPIFRNILPMNCDRQAIRELFRYKTMTSFEAPAILPIFSEAKGSGTPHIQLLSRNGQIMDVSLHDSSTNQNAIIAAESGSGKSFLLNEIVLDYMSEGARVWIIDAGKSYKKICEALGGDFVEFSDNSNISLNPFQTVVDWNSEEDAVVNLLGTMASPLGRLDDYQKAALKSIMHQIWDRTYREGEMQVADQLQRIDAYYENEIAKVRADPDESKNKQAMIEKLENEHTLERYKAMPPSTMTIDAVAAACLQHSDQRVRDVGEQLGSFTSNSNYGKYFAGNNNANFNADLTVLELDELQGRKHLRQVVLLQLISQIQKEIFLGERNRKKIVIIDEAWDMLKEGEVAVFMEGAYRKFRKYGGSAIIATQSAGDLVGTSAGIAIQNNSANTFYLGQKATTLEQLRKENTLVMEDWAFNLLKSVRTEAGVYSEIYFQQGPVQCVGRLVVSEYQKLLYSTNAVDVNAIKQYTDRGLTVDEAIKSVMRDRRLS